MVKLIKIIMVIRVFCYCVIQSTLVQLFPGEAKDKTIPTLPSERMTGDIVIFTIQRNCACG